MTPSEMILLCESNPNLGIAGILPISRSATKRQKQA
jgi:hypothetical protein